MSDAVHSTRSLCNLLNSYQDRRIQNTAKDLSRRVLQKGHCLSEGAQPENFQGRGRECVKLGRFDKHSVKNG